MNKNRHRWRTWVDDDRIRGVLEDAAEQLAWSWNHDKKNVDSYPLNTSYLFSQIAERIENKPVPTTRIKLRLPPPPQSFLDLVDDKSIGAVYEDQNDGSYKDALKEAAAGFGRGHRAFRKIVRALDGAYMVTFGGEDLAPKPRVHFLHRNLLRIADIARLDDLNADGLAEFLDDLCPCGKRHKPDAIRKLRKRSQSRS